MKYRSTNSIFEKVTTHLSVARGQHFDKQHFDKQHFSVSGGEDRFSSLIQPASSTKPRDLDGEEDWRAGRRPAFSSLFSASSSFLLPEEKSSELLSATVSGRVLEEDRRLGRRPAGPGRPICFCTPVSLSLSISLSFSLARNFFVALLTYDTKVDESRESMNRSTFDNDAF